MPMRSVLLLPIVLLGTSGVVVAGEDPLSLTTRIEGVTVYADRAQVVRQGSVDLAPEGSRVVIPRLPGWIDEESVRAALVPAGAGRIVDVSVAKTFLAESSEDAVRKADLAVREVEDKLAALADEEQILAADIQQVEAIRAFAVEKLPKDMATRDVKVQTFADTVDFVAARLRKDHEGLRDLGARRRDLEPVLAARTKERDDLHARAQLEQASVVVELAGTGRATLEVTYLTPGATWEPVSELRVQGQKKVALTQYASVVQTTGEDWEGATLAFSTQRPTDLLNVPEAKGLLLGAGGNGLGEVLTRMGESFDRAQSAYSSVNARLGVKNERWQAQFANQMAIQARVTESFTRLQQRGTTAHFEARTPRAVRADGKSVRVPIASADFDVVAKLVAVPEVSLNVVRTAEITNQGAQPILPGKAALFADGSFVGTSELPFVAPGETFRTFLGVNDHVKLSRTLDHKRSSIERGAKKTKLVVSFQVTAENLGSEPVSVQLSDRVPVAHDEAIEVDDVRIPDGAKRDGDGVVQWTPTLAPKKIDTWRLEYTLEYPSDLMQRARAVEMDYEESNAPSSGARPAPKRSKQMMFHDIEQLENSL